jgi:hypothetical protein
VSQGLLFDAEESHRIMMNMAVQQERHGIQGLLEAAWAWGFDTDTWRAHLSALTWPEVLRQFGLAAGYGPRAPQIAAVPTAISIPQAAEAAERTRHYTKKRGPRGGGGGGGGGSSANKALAAMHPDEDTGGGLHRGRQLRRPYRFKEGTMKADAWTVLLQAGAEGLTLTQMVAEMERQKLRNFAENQTAKTPEATLSGALLRDVVFHRLSPTSYCLRSLHLAAQQGFSAEDMRTATSTAVTTAEDHAAVLAASPNAVAAVDSEEDEDEEVVVHVCEEWVEALRTGEYSDMPVLHRLKALEALINAVSFLVFVPHTSCRHEASGSSKNLPSCKTVWTLSRGSRPGEVRRVRHARVSRPFMTLSETNTPSPNLSRSDNPRLELRR